MPESLKDAKEFKSSNNLGEKYVCWPLWTPDNNPPVALATQCPSGDTRQCGRVSSRGLIWFSAITLASWYPDFQFLGLLMNGSWHLRLTARCPFIHSPLPFTITGFSWVNGCPVALYLSDYMIKFSHESITRS